MRWGRKCGSNWDCCYFLFEKKTLQRYACSSQYRDAGRAIEIQKLGQQWMPRAKQIFPGAALDTRALGSPALVKTMDLQPAAGQLILTFWSRNFTFKF